MSGAEKLLYRVLNVAVGIVLGSPLHGILSGKVMLLGVTGRRSGRTYTVPVSYLCVGEEIVCFTGPAWNVW